MNPISDWLRRVAGILIGKADLLDGLDAQVKAQVSWLAWRRTIIGSVVGWVVGYLTKGM